MIMELRTGETGSLHDEFRLRAQEYDIQIAEVLKSGKLGLVVPPDKNPMVAINTSDKFAFRIFNMAARDVTKQYVGFNQVGNAESSGYSAWELWRLGDTDPNAVVAMVQAKYDELYAKYREHPEYLE